MICLDEYEYLLRKKEKREKKIMKEREKNLVKTTTNKMDASRITIAYEDQSQSCYRFKKNDLENQFKNVFESNNQVENQLKNKIENQNQMHGMKKMFETNQTLKESEKIKNQNLGFQQHIHRIKDENQIEIDVKDLEIQIRENDKIESQNQMKKKSSGQNDSKGQSEEVHSEILSEENFKKINKNPRETLKIQMQKYQGSEEFF